MTAALFNPIQLGKLTLANRIVMPPMTRSRASQPSNSANEMMATYYGQRSSAGLIISEGTQVSALGQGYAWTPGIYSNDQLEGWQKVTDAVHAKNGIMFAQLWHVGRVTHPQNIGGLQSISSSAIAAKNVKVFIDDGSNTPGFVEVSTPREMNKDDIDMVVAEFKQAALNAVNVGFDGIELHAANGYLINQFIDSSSNLRTDNYGGNLENRLRFLDEVIAAMVEAIGAMCIAVFGEGFKGFNIAHLITKDGIGFELFEMKDREARHNVDFSKIGLFHYALETDDFEGVIERVKQYGGKARMDTMRYHPEDDNKPYKMVYLEDPFGSLLELYSHSYSETYSSEYE